jgi:hypothetical protein
MIAKKTLAFTTAHILDCIEILKISNKENLEMME